MPSAVMRTEDKRPAAPATLWPGLRGLRAPHVPTFKERDQHAFGIAVGLKLTQDMAPGCHDFAYNFTNAVIIGLFW